MSESKNCIPENVHKIHLIAVCGTGMGALASMLKSQGFDISGSDQKIYPPMSDFLREQGIHIMDGFEAAHLSDRPDLVIVGNAVTRENPEAREMMQMGIPYCSMPQALNRFFAEDKKALLVAGTHGKTTTASILAWMLYKGGMDPSYMIGGILQNFDSNYRLGDGDSIVIEGDEYDTAFFDKGPKLMHFHPAITVLTSVEFDHADIFRDLDHVQEIFSRFLKQLKASSLLLAFDADENIRRIISDANCRIEYYGSDVDSKWRLGDIQIEAPWSGFEVLQSGQPYGRFKTRLVGRHNLYNALAVIAVADELGLSKTEIGSALESFQGIKRRQQIRGHKNQITVMDDFAHHPTAVRETVAAVKSFYAPRRLIAVFEPRTNSSMRNIFQDVYPLSFDFADLICIRQPPLLDKIPVAERFSSQKLVADLKQRGKDAHFFADTESIIEFLVRHAAPGDLILVMSNGGFDNIHENLLDRL
ncbi:MAG: UDP-N-acetylmuramate:L-alanyl-gamma-D-glutamyl-meso-diaminopimelate ligase [Deltaproteobacteria bacterium]|jgi:UDP-N-acetylmuramate: L-alanyl-gamma-D-glutamyl-meso-diaminopimelate ligase|nr:UDP-N-acetylmuramate:L-alanyl-gamma-D-glutamyl-meso-diaminopimelate ligase [Deltaproteobacteria bacterium]